MQLQPFMRKRVNILFVALATIAVVYGLIVKYSIKPNQDAVSQENSVDNKEVFQEYEDGIVDLETLSTNPD